MAYDLKVTGGRIVDGSGAPPRRGDVGVRAGRIVAVGEAPEPATTEIDATDRVVAPGFIDLHTHYDAQILWDPLLTISPWHGVTTVVMGNCGFGVAPTRAQHRDLILRTLEKVEGMSLAALRAGCGSAWSFETFPEYLDVIERRGAAINVAAYVGHTPVRLWVMGEAATERAATPDEIAAMKRIVREAIDAGAIGFASSKSPTHVGWAGRPVPSRQAEVAEIAAIADALGEAGRGVVQVTAGPGLFVEEMGEIARRTGRPVTWTALLAGLLGPGSHRPLLELSERVVASGAMVVPQVACRPLNFDFDFAEPFAFESLPVFGPVSAADRAGKIAIYRDPAFRDAFRAALDESTLAAFHRGWHRIVVSSLPAAPALEERRVVDLAHERDVDPIDLMLDLALDSDLAARFRFPMLNFDQDEVAELLLHPGTVLGLSDAGAHANQLCDACFATHLLGHWVRERATLTLEQAVWMLTGRPAELLGIRDRGRIAAGLAADLVVLDPVTVGAGSLRRVGDLPAGADRLVADAHGIDAVVVNGTIVRRHGVDQVTADGPLPGRVLRGG